MSEFTGIIKLDELSEKDFFIELSNSETNKIKTRIKEVKTFSDFLLEAEIKDWFYNKTENLRLDKLKNILKLFRIPDIKIKGIRGKQGVYLTNPKFPIDFRTKAGIRFIASILGDGCVHEKGIRYYNKNKNLIETFIKDAKQVFGTINFKTYKNKGVYAITLPEIYKKILEEVGMEEGSKIKNNVTIPKFIFNENKEKIIEFVSRFIDDEGSITNGKIIIDLSFDCSKSPKLIFDIQKLLETIGVKSSVFRIRNSYKSSRGPDRQMWRLGIFTFSEIVKLKHMQLNHPKKKKLFGMLLSSKRKTVYRGIAHYLISMKEIEKQKGFFTVEEIAKENNRSLIHAGRVMNTFKKQGLIKQVDSQYKGHKNIVYAKYKVIA